MNEKSQVTKKRLYSKERKRRRVSGTRKDVTGQLKSTEKQKDDAVKRSEQFEALTLAPQGDRGI
jgi:hypothetical protein